jgi:heme-degrading monooxygenase HmoA
MSSLPHPCRPSFRLLRRFPLALAALLSASSQLGCAGSQPAPQTQPGGADRAHASVPASCAARIARVWHGRTPNGKADAYATYLADAITKFRSIPGNLGYQMMRETAGAETHFLVISYWASREAIRAYAGDDIQKTHSLPRDPEFLIDPEQTVMNYELAVVNLDCPP